MQIKYVSVAFVEGGKNYSFTPNDLELKIGDKVVVETARGLEVGTVVAGVSDMEDNLCTEPLKKVVRKASDDDLKRKSECTSKEQTIKVKTEEIIEKLKLEMKISSVEVGFDNNKVIISFTADNRVDFRELVKELASIFKARIELRQIGSRDEAKIIGGLGPCGRQCCCNLFLDDFEHSTIKMAKMQGLSLNPTKISGMCGRLKCCLAYENAHYSETFKLMPKLNSEVITPDGKGLVIYNDLLDRIVTVKFINGDTQEVKDYKLENIKVLSSNVPSDLGDR